MTRSNYDPSQSLPLNATDDDIHARSLWLARQRSGSWVRDEDLPKLVREYGEAIRDSVRRALKKEAPDDA